MGACRYDRIARPQEAQSRERWGHAGSVAPLGTAHARRRTLAAGSGPPLAARRPRFAILASLAAEPGSRARAAPRCRPQEAQSRKRWGHVGTTASLGFRKPNRVSDGGTLAPLHRSELPMPVAGHSLRAPALRSLHAGCASPSWLRLPPNPALGRGQPLARSGFRKPNRVSDGGSACLHASHSAGPVESAITPRRLSLGRSGSRRVPGTGRNLPTSSAPGPWRRPA